MNSEQELITQEDAATQLGVQRATLYYYMRALNIKGKKFPLDRHKYLSMADFEEIKKAKEAAQTRGKQKPEESTGSDDLPLVA